MTNGRQMGANLMASSCNQGHLQQCECSVAGQRQIFGHDRDAVLHFQRINAYGIRALILFQEARNQLFLLYLTGNQTLLVLVYASVLKHLIHHLEARQGFSGHHQSAGVSVQPVADRRLKGAQLGYGKLS